MTSIKQFNANRANATKSSGPKTAAGKQRSRMNAVKHGLTAATLVLAGEHADDFDSLRAALQERFQPQCVLEDELVERLAVTYWRLRRVPLFEAAVLEARKRHCRQLGRMRRRAEEGASPELAAVGEALIQDAQYGDAFRKLGRQEITLMTVAEKTLRTLADLRRVDQEGQGRALRAA
ncbi:hypothetical protein [Methyloceanibacter superfactus]|nr:hypothetical protein [Methyloceanibacter superfactus]